MTSMTVTVPPTVDLQQLERELVTAIADRLRDDYGCRLAAGSTIASAEARNEYPMNPAGKIVIDKKTGALKVKLRGIKVDARDLFTGVSSELGLRHEELRTEIG